MTAGFLFCSVYKLLNENEFLLVDSTHEWTRVRTLPSRFRRKGVHLGSRMNRVYVGRSSGRGWVKQIKEQITYH